MVAPTIREKQAPHLPFFVRSTYQVRQDISSTKCISIAAGEYRRVPAERKVAHSEYKLHKEHINDSAGGDGKEHFPFPKVNKHHRKNADKLGQAVAVGGYGHTL